MSIAVSSWDDGSAEGMSDPSAAHLLLIDGGPMRLTDTNRIMALIYVSISMINQIRRDSGVFLGSWPAVKRPISICYSVRLSGKTH